jgi:predicted transcriptional regulator of viral defense system
MTRLELQNALDKIDKQNVWAFSLNLIQMLFPLESVHTIAISLSRHVKSGIITQACRGVYTNPRSSSVPSYSAEALAYIIRPGEQFYLSLETALSEAGYLSQMPNRLTFMTTGRSQTFNTPYGIIEFVHSGASRLTFLHDCEYDDRRGIWIATTRKAANDAKKTRRSLDLIDWDELAA